MRKKAITPLISTVLLIVFAVGLGTLVMSWGKAQKTGTDMCSYAEMQITELNGSRQICLHNQSIKAVLENNGKVDIKGIEVVFLMPDNVLRQAEEADIRPGEFAHLDFPLKAGDKAKILKIRLIPQLEYDKCVNKRVEIEGVSDCEP